MTGQMVEQDRSTQRLVAQAREGDRQAFEELVARFRDRLSSSVQSWSRFQLGPPVDADEVIHETFIRAFRSLSSFEWRDDDSFFRWLCGVAKRAMAQLFEDGQGHQGAQAIGAAENVSNSGPSQSKVQRRHERFDRLEAALEKLAPEYREVLLLSRIEGLSAPQIAVRMNRSANAVRHLIVRALRELRDKFGDDTASFNLPDRQFHGAGEDDE